MPSAFLHMIQQRPAYKQACATAAFAVACAAPASTSAQDISALTQGETYWKTNIVDAVIAMRPCPETTVCARLVWFNPEDDNLHTYFGIPGQRAQTPEQLRRSFCNFSPRMTFTQTSPTTGEGTLDARGMRMTFNIRATLINDRQIDMRISKAFITKRDKWTRIDANDPRYPHCTPLAR